MSLILPAFSSPDLKAFLLPKKSFKSSAGGQTGPLRVPAARQCDLFRSAVAALHKSHRLAYPRISVVAFVILSVGMCQSRKDPYLPLLLLCVRLLPRPTGLPPMAFAVSFRIRFADAKTAVKHHRSKSADGRLGVGANITVMPRPEGVLLGMYAMCSIFRLSPPDVLPVLKNLVTC